MSENQDPELQKLMDAKYKRIAEINSDPQERANVLVQRYVSVVDKIMLGTGNYNQDYEELTKIREEATRYGLSFEFDIKVKSI